MMEQTPLSPIFWNKVLGGGSPGPAPSGSISITENGTYDVAAFAEANVNVPSGPVIPPLLKYVEVTAAADYDQSNRLNVQVEPTTHHYIVLVFVKFFPEPPPEGSYAFLCASRSDISTASNGILRPNGTIGNDAEMLSFSPTSGVVSIGGSYGKIFAGTTLCIIELEVL